METSVPDPASAPTGVGIVVMVAFWLAAAWMYANLIWAVPHIRRALLRVPEEHRKIPHRWLGLLCVPIINFPSVFLVGLGLPRSIHAALDAQGDAEGIDCGRWEGCILVCIVNFANMGFFMALDQFGPAIGSEPPPWAFQGALCFYGGVVTRKFVRKISRVSQLIVAK